MSAKQFLPQYQSVLNSLRHVRRCILRYNQRRPFSSRPKSRKILGGLGTGFYGRQQSRSALKNVTRGLILADELGACGNDT